MMLVLAFFEKQFLFFRFFNYIYQELSNGFETDV